MWLENREASIPVVIAIIISIVLVPMMVPMPAVPPIFVGVTIIVAITDPAVVVRSVFEKKPPLDG
jgi:hypothetical protein